MMARTGMIPIGWIAGLPVKGGMVRLVGSRDVQALTGLSADQLREWTYRRGLLRPDRPARGKGTQARFSWQTVLALRVACVLKTAFHLELQAHRQTLADLQERLQGVPFHGLWGSGLAIRPGAQLSLVTGPMGSETGEVPLLWLPLAPHLQVLADSFGLAEPVRQLTLFPVTALR